MATLFNRTGRPEQRKRRQRADRLGGMLEYELDALLVPGGAVGVFEGDEQVVVGRGRCSVDDRSPVDEQTRFQVGSVAKLFTATAAFLLVKEHRLDLDSPVSDAIEERGDPGSLEGVTVRHLLSHRTGWAPDWFVDHVPEVPNDDTALAAFIDHVRCVPRLFQPGQVFSYDNAAYSVLGRAVEVSSGLPFEAALNELVAQPFGMEQIRFAREGLANELALGHQLVDGRIVEFSEATTALGGWNFPAFMAPAGGAVVSIADLLTFARRHLDSPQLAEMRIPISTSGGQGEEICVGWHLKRIGRSISFLHTGRGKGYCARLTLLPEKSAAVAVLVNADHGSAAAASISAAALREFFDVAAPEGVATYEPVAVEEFCGTFEMRGLRYEVAQSSEGLSLRQGRSTTDRTGPWQPIDFYDVDRFRVGVDTEAEFVRVEENVVGLRWMGRVAPRVVDVEPR